MSTCCVHQEGTNPRIAGTCVKCGRPIEPEDTEGRPQAVIQGGLQGVTRHGTYEAAFLLEASAEAERRYGMSNVSFPDVVRRRLDSGERVYGDAWVTRENGPEIAEEAQDAAAYAVLDAQKRLALDDDEASWLLFEIAVHAAALDALARRLPRVS